MGKRSTYKPMLTDVLEERLVMSVSATAHVAPGIHAAAMHAPPNVRNTPIQLGPIGTLGDSYTDEYQFYPPNRSMARNWVEMLHTLRLVNFGPFTRASRGEPRDQGFAYNWARSEATSVTMIQNQLPGLASQAAHGQIRYAWIFIGGNDFIHYAETVAAGAVPPSQVLAGLVQTTAQVETNFATAVATLQAADPNIKLVVSTLPDIATSPLARQLAATPQGQVLLGAISQAINSYNTEIRTYAQQPNIALADLAAITAQLTTNTTGTVQFGGTTINLVTPGNDYHNFFLADGLHIGTVGQGIIADTIVQALDTKFDAQLFPIPPNMIVRYAAAVQHNAMHAHR